MLKLVPHRRESSVAAVDDLESPLREVFKSIKFPSARSSTSAIDSQYPRHSFSRQYSTIHFNNLWSNLKQFLHVNISDLYESFRLQLPVTSLISVILFNFIVTSLALVSNKVLLTYYNDFKMNFMYLSLQSIFGAMLLLIAKGYKLVRIRRVRLKDLIIQIPVSCCLVLMIYSSSKSLEHCSIPLFMIYKNMGTILIVFGEYYVYNRQLNAQFLVSFILLVFAGGMAALISMSFTNSTGTDYQMTINNTDVVGLYWMCLNSVSGSLFVLMMRKSVSQLKLHDPIDTIFYNSLISGPLMLVISLISEDWNGFYAQYFSNVPSESGASPRSYLVFTFVCYVVCSSGVHYASSLCSQVTSPRWYGVISALNKIPMTLASMIFFSAHTARFTSSIMSCLAVSSFGAILLNWSRLQSSPMMRQQSQEQKIALSDYKSDNASQSKDTTERITMKVKS
ncbi:hypothetical protein MP228_005272 [Amoeboaphelidium protococcarum]|nr:hypothetical protein MP228_005272 [Amoeboaphelidium protococcarum]